MTTRPYTTDPLVLWCAVLWTHKPDNRRGGLEWAGGTIGGSEGQIGMVALVILAALVAVALVSSLWAVLPCGHGWDALALNLGTEMAGAVVTYALLELVIGRREKLKERSEEKAADLRARKEELIAQLGSRVIWRWRLLRI